MRLATAGIALTLLSLAACQTDERTPLPGPTPTAAPGEIDGVTPLPSPLPGVAAQVNGQPVPTRNVRLAAEQAIARGAVKATERAFAYRQATQNLIERELMFQEATRRQLTVDAEALQKAADQARVGHKDDSAWRQFLAQQGMDEQAFRAELRVQHMVQALMMEIARQVPSQTQESEERAFYDENPHVFESGERFRASHILLRVEKDASAERKAAVRLLAQGVLDRVQKGESFAALARQYSQDGDSAPKGGELPLFSKWEMAPSISGALESMKPGAVSPLLETPFGFQIFKLYERLPSQKTPFEQAREQARQQVLARRRQEALQAVLQKLKSQAKIETYL
jgi:parvulin-like peptidyl-prolyl isomerase